MNKSEINWVRIRNLLKLGIIAACMVFVADMVLGWGTYNYEVKELPAMWARFLLVSDERIVISAILGLIGIPLECLCWFAVYRMISHIRIDMITYTGWGFLGVLHLAAVAYMCPAAWLRIF